MVDKAAENKKGILFSTSIPTELAGLDQIAITLELPHVAKSRDMGFGIDLRNLAIALFSFKRELVQTKIPEEGS